LCLGAEQSERGTIEEYDFDLLSIEVAGGDDDLLRATLKQLQRLRIITDDGICIVFVHFLDRQYDRPSTQPEAVRKRVTKHRETQGNAMKRDVTRIQEERRGEQNRVEKKERERARPRRKTTLPEDFIVTDAMYHWASMHCPDLDVGEATETWRDAMLAKGFEYIDWPAAWRNGMKNAVKWDTERNKGQKDESTKFGRAVLRAGREIAGLYVEQPKPSGANRAVEDNQGSNIFRLPEPKASTGGR
jgi:hypothetical protein